MEIIYESDEVIGSIFFSELDACGCMVDEGLRVLGLEPVDEVDRVRIDETMHDGGVCVGAVTQTLEFTELGVERLLLTPHYTYIGFLEVVGGHLQPTDRWGFS